MNNLPIFFYFSWLIPLLAAAGTIFWVNYIYRTKPGSRLAGLLLHRDHVWLGVLSLLIPSLVNQFIFWHLFRSPYGGLLYLVIAINSLVFGGVYGMAACWFASPGKRPERFNAWMALAVAVALMVAHWMVLQVWWRPLIGLGRSQMPLVYLEGLLVLCYVIWRGIRKEVPVAEAPPGPADEKKYDPMHAFLWVLLGLLPIPLLLITVTSNGAAPTLIHALMIICPICCLCGGIGCLGGIKSIPVRIILGLFLAVFFLGLAVTVAIFQACSHGAGGI